MLVEDWLEKEKGFMVGKLYCFYTSPEVTTGLLSSTRPASSLLIGYFVGLDLFGYPIFEKDDCPDRFIIQQGDKIITYI